jgi:citrate synthase
MREYVPLAERDAAAAGEKGAADEKDAGVTDGQ